MTTPRTADHPIDRQFLDRWSPRAFTGEALPAETLLTLLEAARWAPSAFNSQPWRFVYAHRDTPAWGPVFDTLSATNQGWARQAGALVVVLSSTHWTPPGKDAPEPLRSHAFDAGAAWGYLALQARLAGWDAHAMGGFDRERARQSLGLPETLEPQAVVAIGRRGDKSVLPDALQAREAPNGRRPLAGSIFEGRVGPAASGG
ncbi:nitroreductase family protein [Piscinibacter sakaiensis]|uniref:Nitroreductase family protein n=1 Tax=Piscinibacter sakaiensis TaxID=1547922 RepID=A0A0K8NXI1_PISS1|nr:nitroreductase family protein [Piscinibacter sakaiensis]GAP35107.1 nitroreductase family protein [Piscinibacter sakaiensis]